MHAGCVKVGEPSPQPLSHTGRGEQTTFSRHVSLGETMKMEHVAPLLPRRGEGVGVEGATLT